MYPIKKQLLELSEAVGSSKEKLSFINYERFQWRRNLDYIRHFETSSNVVTLRDAVHYVASDVPYMVENSMLKHLLGLMEWFKRKPSRPAMDSEVGYWKTVDLAVGFLAEKGVIAKGDDKIFSDLVEEDKGEVLIRGTEFMDLPQQDES